MTASSKRRFICTPDSVRAPNTAESPSPADYSSLYSADLFRFLRANDQFGTCSLPRIPSGCSAATPERRSRVKSSGEGGRVQELSRPVRPEGATSWTWSANRAPQATVSWAPHIFVGHNLPKDDPVILGQTLVEVMSFKSSTPSCLQSVAICRLSAPRPEFPCVRIK